MGRNAAGDRSDSLTMVHTRRRLDAADLAQLVEANSQKPQDLEMATELASRYLTLGLGKDAQVVLQRATSQYDMKEVARIGGQNTQLLGQAYLQLARACDGERERQVRYATLSYNLNPSVGLRKQPSRPIHSCENTCEGSSM